MGAAKILSVFILLLFSDCNWNRLADEDATEEPRPGLPDDENGNDLDALLYEEARLKCLDIINDYRRTEDSYPYKRWTSNEECADNHAKIDSEHNLFHYAFKQDNCGARFQCECPSFKPGSAKDMIDNCLENMWNEQYHPEGEQGHYLAMSSQKWSMVSCGFYKTPEGRIWAVQNYR